MIIQLSQFTIATFEAFQSIGLNDLLSVYLLTSIYFILLYFGFALGAHLVTCRVLPSLRLGKITYVRSGKTGQIKSEITYSLLSCAVFGLIGVGTFVAYRLGYFEIVWFPSVGKVLADLTILFFWNEIHFYCTHRVLHLRLFFSPIHSIHHASVIPTPFSTYSFHPTEAFLNGTVIWWVLLVIPFSFTSLILFPIVSLAINTLAHSNYSLTSAGAAVSERHGAHHLDTRGEYGFLLPILDQMFKTTATRLRRSEV